MSFLRKAWQRLLVTTIGVIAVTAPAGAQLAGLENVRIEQKLAARLPLNVAFRDEHGDAVRLGDFFGRVPVILTFNYYDCPMLCPLELNDLLRAVRAIPLDLGSQFQIVTISIDPNDTPARAAEKQQWYLERYSRSHGAAGWHFLTGTSESIAVLADAVGFRYARDPRSGQYAHIAGIVVATPDGRLARYLFGLEYSARDLKLALVDASGGRIGSLADQMLLLCFHYDPESGRYGLAILRAIRAGGLMTALGLCGLMAVMFRRERTGARKR